MKRKYFLMYCIITFSVLGYGQNTNLLDSTLSIEEDIKELVKELVSKVEVSDYQQKLTIKVLTRAAHTKQKIEHTSQGATERTIALEEHNKKTESSLRRILNTIQYEMLAALLEDE